MSAAKSADALLIIDVINDLEFPGGEKVFPWAKKMVDHLVPFAARMRAANVPVIYVNDNFGRWQSSFQDVFAYCTRNGARGAEISAAMLPEPTDYFVLKPKQSAFFATSLVPLLSHLGTKRLILSGIATNLCVSFSAHDAHMHGYELVVLSDCCAAETSADHDTALDQLGRFLPVQTCRSAEFATHAAT